jgi:hypothetical protein
MDKYYKLYNVQQSIRKSRKQYNNNSNNLFYFSFVAKDVKC